MKILRICSGLALALAMTVGCMKSPSLACESEADCFLEEKCEANQCVPAPVCGEGTIACSQGCCEAPGIPSPDDVFINQNFIAHGALAVDDVGIPSIVSFNTDEELLVMTWNGSRWETTVPQFSNVRSVSDKVRAYFHENSLYILYCGSGDAGGLGPALAWQQDGVWMAEVLANITTCPNDFSLVFDSRGEPHVAYRYLSRIDRAYRDEFGRWQGSNHAQNDVMTFKTPMVIDRRDRLHIVYGTVERLRYDVVDGETTERYPFATGPVPDAAIVLDANEELHVVFSAFKHEGISVPQDLEYIRHNGQNWSEPVKIEDRLSVIYNASIVIDSKGYAHTVYTNAQLKSLKISSWDGERWRGRTVDSDGDTGASPQMVIDGWDRKHMIYFEGRNEANQLRYRWIL